MPQSKDAFDPLIGQVDWESSEKGGDGRERKRMKLFISANSLLKDKNAYVS